MASLIQNLYYVSPYSPLPPGYSISGIVLQTDPAQSPTPNTVKPAVLVIRLRMAANKDVVIGVSATEGSTASLTTAILQPNIPLSATDSYMIDIIWVKEGMPPPSIPWESAVASAPITAAQVKIISASFDSTGTKLTAHLDYGPTGMAVGAQVNVFSLSGGVYVNIGSAQTQDNVITVPADRNGLPAVYFLSSQAIISTTNVGGSGSFTAPFSLGPQTNITALSGIPQAAKTISYATYNGNTLSVAWELDNIAGCVSPDSSRIEVLSGGKVIAAFTGGPTSAIIPLEVYGQSGVTINVSTVSNNLGSAPVSFSLITQAPVVTNVTTTMTAGKVTAAVATDPGTLGVQAFLMEGNNILAGPVTAAGGYVSFDAAVTNKYDVNGMVGLSILAQATDPGNPKIVGPQNQRVFLLATAPAIKSAEIYTNPANQSQWRVDINWDRLPDAAENVTSYTAAVLQDNAIVENKTTTGTSASIIINKSAIDLGKTQSIRLSATGATGGASPSQSWFALFKPPTLSSLTTTNNQVAAKWTATPPVGNTMPVLYRLIAVADNTIIYRGNEITGSSGSIPLADLAVATSANITILVSVAVGPVTLMPDASMGNGAYASPILTAPLINPVNTEVVTDLAMLSWTAVNGATKEYVINFTSGNPQTSATTTLRLQQALHPADQLGYWVQAKGISNGVALVGPPSETAFVPTNITNISQAKFDGSNGSLAWEAVPGAYNYLVSVFDSDNKLEYAGLTSQAFIKFSVPAGKKYTAYVQPKMNNGIALSSPRTELFSSGIFVSQQPSTAAYPYLYIAQSQDALGSANANPPAQTVVLYLPALGDLGTAAITVPPFTIEPSDQPALPYKLTIAGSALAWSFNTDAIRLQLQSAYVDFLKKIEKPSVSLTGATPYGISLVQTAIACALPQTFAELLYYNFGFSTVSNVGAGYIDLRPGMILRVSASDYIAIPQSQLPSWINGYAGGTTMDYEIGSYNAGATWKTGFDAFLSTLSAQGALGVTAPRASGGYTQAGVAGAVDLYFSQFIQPFYRLYFPSAINAAWDVGSNSTQSNFTLVAAAKYTDLQSTNVNPSNTPTAYFRGRAIVQAMIKVLVNGMERIVPVGTTLGNLLDQLGLRPSAVSAALGKLRVYRSVTGAITNTNPAAALAPKLELKLNWNGFPVYGAGNGLNATSLPLLPGDEIITAKMGS
jgi:trimeric autotransporter adhesin